MSVRHLGRALAGLALVAILALLGALVVVPRIMGWVPLTILTGSMEPTIPTGSQVVVEEVDGEADARELEVGDVITVMPYPNDPTLVTHRIVERHDSSNGVGFVTQGDANGAVDAWDVTATQIRGEVRYHVPYAGYVATALDGGQKAAGAIVAAAALLTYAAVQVLGAVRGARRHGGAAGEDPALDVEDGGSAASTGAGAEAATTDASGVESESGAHARSSAGAAR
ncbi:signal peptidase I [Georgenia sp. Z1491]|uniref:signal peptidase I n=1 Tax=Georgenia sp. Z1491 TaxID=3416707 RepID=UPI003CFB24A0